MYGRFSLAYEPRVRRFYADHWTPTLAYQALKDRRPTLLESAEFGERVGRYSVLAFDPLATFVYQDGAATIAYRANDLMHGRETAVVEVPGTPQATLELFLQGIRRCSEAPEPETPFVGAAIGAFDFELAYAVLESADGAAPSRIAGEPLIRLFVPRRLIVFDHLRQTLDYVVLDPVLERGVRPEASRFEAEVQELQARLEAARLTPLVAVEPDALEIRSNFTREAFIDAVRAVQEEIRSAGAEQIVFSQRFDVQTDVEPFLVYRFLRSNNPSPYMYLLDLGDDVYVGSSPESLVRIEGRTVSTRPIAGTRPRGRTPAEDRRLEAELLDDAKETAEHEMLVRLAEDDLRPIARSGSVAVDAYRTVERYSHVMHLVSHVSAVLRDGVSPLAAVFRLFPAGTVSGAPRKAALSAIARLEPERRGVYGGAVGWIHPEGATDLAIAIRTIHFHPGGASVQVGAGIVAASSPEREYEETVNKAQALLEALARAAAHRAAVG
ncbi:MAG: anthranilate synthase component I family protein [Hydrogenibacillus sp.]|nr:anthranilate synthase component I family protein [Hydrogenibacillus sp.]